MQNVTGEEEGKERIDGARYPRGKQEEIRLKSSVNRSTLEFKN